MAPSPFLVNESESPQSRRRRRPGCERVGDLSSHTTHNVLKVSSIWPTLWRLSIAVAGGVLYRCALHPEGVLFSPDCDPELRFISGVSFFGQEDTPVCSLCLHLRTQFPSQFFNFRDSER